MQLETYSEYGDVEETADNYAQNAALKARALFEQLCAAGLRHAVLADDSGIEVDALGGRPGVRSARYAPNLTWPARLNRLLEEVGDRPACERGAKFVCAMTLILPDGMELEGYGEVCGQLTCSMDGTNGFGYDPIFYYPPLRTTFGQLPQGQKNELSHRRNAARALLEAYRRV